MKIRTLLIAVAFTLMAVSAGIAQDQDSTSGPPPAVQAGPSTEASSPTSTEVSSPTLTGAQSRTGATGTHDVLLNGMLIPSVFASGVVTQNSGNTGETASFSGDLAYSRTSAQQETDFIYSGGALINNGSSYAGYANNSSFQDFSIAESVKAKRWSFLAGDAVSYSPQSPVGLGAGVPGVAYYAPAFGLGSINTSLVPNNSVLTFNSPRLDNAAVVQASYSLSRQTSVTAVMSYGLLNYLDNPLLNDHQWITSAGVDHVMRDSTIGLEYSYSRFAYDSTPGYLATDAVEVLYSRNLTRSLRAEVGAGPEILKVYGFSIPGRTSGAANAGLYYTRRLDSFGLTYSRGINGGSGLLVGANTDTVQFVVGRTYRTWAVGANATYTSNSGIAGIVGANAAYISNSGITAGPKVIGRSAGGQVSHSLARTVRAYLSYTFMSQGAAVCSAGLCAFNGAQNLFGFGLQWHPRPVRLAD